MKNEFLNSETLEMFATARITNVKIITLGNLTDEDYEGHEKFESVEVMYGWYRKVYPNNEVGPETELKIIKFVLIR